MTQLNPWRQRMTPHHILLAIATLILGVAATLGVKASLDNWREGQWKRRLGRG